ncbi:MAG: carboxypeptidase-like regulatory domain-containing protein, partial [Gemmatirosa sp.]
MSHVAACRHSRTARLAAFAILASPLSLAAQGASPSSPSVGSIGGLVVDSLLGGGPLAHVEVWIDGTTRTARTDRAGRFRFDAVPAGRHRLAFVHPTLDAQRIGTPTATVDVTAGMHAEARLVTPSASAVHAARCPPGAEARTGLLLGHVSPPDAAGIAADVVVSWSVLTIARGRVQAVPRELTVRSGDDGAFRLCGVPIDLPVQLRAQGADGALAVAEVAFDG